MCYAAHPSHPNDNPSNPVDRDTEVVLLFGDFSQILPHTRDPDNTNCEDRLDDLRVVWAKEKSDVRERKRRQKIYNLQKHEKKVSENTKLLSS